MMTKAKRAASVVPSKQPPRQRRLVLWFAALGAYAVVSVVTQQRHVDDDRHDEARTKLWWRKNSLSQLVEPEQNQLPRYYPGRRIYSQNNDNNGSHRPALDTLVQRNGSSSTTRKDNSNDDDDNVSVITGDVQFLLDFVIAGFGKAGTTTMMEWLARHPGVAIFSREVYHLVQQRPDRLVRALYQDLPADNDYSHYLRGYKNPFEVTQRHVLDYYRTLFPRTKLIVGVRHPIRWFESLYNFRVVQNRLLQNQSMPHPNALIGRCYPDRLNTCTEKGNFAHALLQLGKTNNNHHNDPTPRRHQASSPLAERIVGRYKRLWFNVSTVPYVPNPIFLFHMEQLQNPTSAAALGRDLCAFLGIDAKVLPPLPPHAKPGLKLMVNDTTRQRQLDDDQIDICDPDYQPVRHELWRMGSLGAAWMEQEFLNSSSDQTVHVADPRTFSNLLRSWSTDPCAANPAAGSRQRERSQGLPKRNDPFIRAASPLRIHMGGS